MSERGNTGFVEELFVLSERDHVSLYLQYPEIHSPAYEGSDETESMSHNPSIDRSPQSLPLLAMPLSDHGLSGRIDTTPHRLANDRSPPSTPPPTLAKYATPPTHIRHKTPTSSLHDPQDSTAFPSSAMSGNNPQTRGVPEYDSSLDLSRMPGGTRPFFANMKFVVVAIKDILRSGEGVSSDVESVSRVKVLADWMIRSLKQGQDHVQMEIDAVESIVQLAPFTVRPKPEDLWTNYQQMAELIIRQTNLPSHRVLGSLHRLHHIYNACVYRPVLASRPGSTDPEYRNLLTLLDTLYDADLTLIARYQQWIKSMQRVGRDYTRPVLRRIMQSPEAMKKIEEAEAHKAQALNVFQGQRSRR